MKLISGFGGADCDTEFGGFAVQGVDSVLNWEALFRIPVPTPILLDSGRVRQLVETPSDGGTSRQVRFDGP